jgi:8-oxo-dGTP pyrophosphatase MutT (NUDIX family)
MQKYKVFINDKWIFFEEFRATELFDKETFDMLKVSNHLLYNLSEMIKLGNFDQNISIKPSEEIPNPFEVFLNYFHVLEAAGGLVQHANSTYLMIKRFGVWDFPKGKIEKGEINSEAALREVEEETGVKNLAILKELPTSYHIYSYKGKWIVKRTFWYLMQSDFTGALIPQLEEDIHEAIWVPKEEVQSYMKNTYANLRSLVQDSDLF